MSGALEVHLGPEEYGGAALAGIVKGLIGLLVVLDVFVFTAYMLASAYTNEEVPTSCFSSPSTSQPPSPSRSSPAPSRTRCWSRRSTRGPSSTRLVPLILSRPCPLRLPRLWTGLQLDRFIQKTDARDWGLTVAKFFLIDRAALLTVHSPS